MAKADCVHSTPPTRTPISQNSSDPTRRYFLTVAAGASVASVGTLAVAAMPTAAALAASDPIYAAIERRRAAQVAADAATAEIERLCDLADEIVGPNEIDVSSMIEPGTTVKASSYSDIEQAVPRQQFPEQFAHYLALLRERSAARRAFTGDTDPMGKEQYEAEWQATVNFANTVPTTVPGLLAMITYAAEIRETDNEAFTDHNCMLIDNLAIAAKALIKVQAGKAVQS
jgi:hypothetical protein